MGGELASICREHGARRVILFGSASRGWSRAAADLDLAIEGVPAASFFDRYGRLLLASPVPVDLVDFADAPDSLRERIRSEGLDL